MTKQERHAAIRERTANAIRDLYHNATPDFWRVKAKDEKRFSDTSIYDVLHEAGQSEIEYLNDGGAYGPDYRKTLSAACNAGRYKSEKARQYYIAKGMRAYRYEMAKRPMDRITEYGKIYQWGRGGRTLAPDGLIRERGIQWRVNEDLASEMTIRDCVKLIAIVEDFNRYVTEWNSAANLQFIWNEYEADNTSEADEAAAIEYATT